jgi:hypothetical protein
MPMRDRLGSPAANITLAPVFFVTFAVFVVTLPLQDGSPYPPLSKVDTGLGPFC